MVGFFHEVKIIHTTRGPKKEGKNEEIILFYGKTATFGQDPDCWQWVDGFHFLNYTTKFSKDSIINKNLGIIHAADK